MYLVGKLTYMQDAVSGHIFEQLVHQRFPILIQFVLRYLQLEPFQIRSVYAAIEIDWYYYTTLIPIDYLLCGILPFVWVKLEG